MRIIRKAQEYLFVTPTVRKFLVRTKKNVHKERGSIARSKDNFQTNVLSKSVLSVLSSDGTSHHYALIEMLD